MKAKTLLSITLLAACIIPSFSYANNPEKGEKKAPDPAKMFQKLDADKSGGISSEEAASNKGLTKRFEKIDANEDGEISLDELKASLVKKPKKGKAKNSEDEE